MDDFYDLPHEGSSTASPGFGPPLPVLVTAALAPFLVIIATRLLSGRSSQNIKGRGGRSVWRPPYWMPFVGHAFSFLYDPVKLMNDARDQSPHGIFSLYLGGSTHNIISNPLLVKGVMQQRESTLEFQSTAWTVVQKFFGFPKKSKTKLFKVWEEMLALNSDLMKEPHLGELLQRTIRNLERNIPRMISFMDGEIDLEPWERWAYASFISSSETEVNLMSLVRDMMGLASVPALFGRALLDNHPDILLDIYDLDKGMMYFLMGLPRWTPWFPVTRAHLARARISRTLNAYHTALDATVEGKPVDSAWGDLEDVSDLIWKRRAMFKGNGLAVEERGDMKLLWALVVNATLLVYWQIHYILSVPGLLPLILTETTPYAYVTKPESIGRISEAPKLTLDYENLSKKCPLLKSTYLEALRLTAKPWSIRKATKDVVISEANNPASPISFSLNKGEYVTIPHDLHMRDPKYFTDPEKFDPERFLVKNEDGSVSTNSGTIRPFGGGASMCPGRILAEKECLAFVAGMLVFWDFQPADKSGWLVPGQKKTGGVSLPGRETRVRIKKRKFEWDD